MNIILIVSDTLRRDHLGCYGGKVVLTPNLDRLAEEAVVFDQFYSGSFQPALPGGAVHGSLCLALPRLGTAAVGRDYPGRDPGRRRLHLRAGDGQSAPGALRLRI